MNRYILSTALGAVFAVSATPLIAQDQPSADATAPTSAATAPTAEPQAAAQSPITAGQTILDAQGGTVGTVDAVDAQFVTVATTKSKVKVPIGNFAKSDKGPVLGMTAAQVDAAAGPAGAAASASASGAASAGDQAPAAAAAKPTLEKGAVVSDTQGGKVGTIEEAGPEFVTVATAKNKARLPVSAFAAGEAGPVIAMTAAQLDASVDAAKPKTASR